MSSFKEEMPPMFEIVSKKTNELVWATDRWEEVKEYCVDENYHAKMPDGSWYPDDYKGLNTKKKKTAKKGSKKKKSPDFF